MAGSVTMTWYGHACFKAEAGGYSILLDPYGDGKVPGLNPLRQQANQVLCSHEHEDHNFREGIRILAWEGAVPWKISWIDTYHDDKEGALRGANRIHILDYEDLRVVHLGDLGCGLTPDQIKEIGKPDVLMIPVGGYYTINAAKAKETAGMLQPRVTIPMHYRSGGYGFDVIGTLDEYTGLCDDIVCYNTNTLTVTEDTKKQTAVLVL